VTFFSPANQFSIIPLLLYRVADPEPDPEPDPDRIHIQLVRDPDPYSEYGSRILGSNLNFFF
jgi:hypothetical protein